MNGVLGFDHGAGHPLLFLDDAKAPNCQKNNGFNGLGNYSEWPKVAGAVIQAVFYPQRGGFSPLLDLVPIAMVERYAGTCIQM